MRWEADIEKVVMGLNFKIILMLSLSTMVCYILLIHVFYMYIKWKPIVVAYQKQAKDIFGSLAIITILLFLLLPNLWIILTSPIDRITKVLGVCSWVGVGLLLIVSLTIEPKLFSRGLYYQGKYFTWDKIDKLEYIDDYLRLTVKKPIPLIAPNFHVKVRADYETVKEFAEKYIGKPIEIS